MSLFITYVWLVEDVSLANLEDEKLRESLGKLNRKMLLIASMYFMDPYNFDLEKVQRCCIHYGVPDGRIIPFCTMNSIHRSKIEEQLGIPINEWQQKHKREVSAVA